MATDETNIPVSISKVSGTPMDFKTPYVIGDRINQNHEQLKFGKGYDHTWVISGPENDNGELKHAATLRDPGSGRKMDIYTDQPGIQFLFRKLFRWKFFRPFRGKFILSDLVCV